MLECECGGFFLEGGVWHALVRVGVGVEAIFAVDAKKTPRGSRVGLQFEFDLAQIDLPSGEVCPKGRGSRERKSSPCPSC